MAQLMLVNPRRRRRRNPESSAERSAAARRGWAKRRSEGTASGYTRSGHHEVFSHRRRRRNPKGWFDHSAAHRRAALEGWAHRRGRHRRRRRNPIEGGVMHLLKESAVLSGSAVGLDLVWGFLPLPATIKGNAGLNALAKGATALLIGTMVGGRNGELVAMGGVTIALYDAFRSVVTTFMPSLTLGYTGAGVNVGSPMGIYLPESSPATPLPSPSGNKVTGMGMYIPAKSGT